MNSKEFLLAALDAEVDYKKRAYKSLYEVRNFVRDLPENHPSFLIIRRQENIKKQAEEIMSFLWQLEQQSLKPIADRH